MLTPVQVNVYPIFSFSTFFPTDEPTVTDGRTGGQTRGVIRPMVPRHNNIGINRVITAIYYFIRKISRNAGRQINRIFGPIGLGQIEHLVAASSNNCNQLITAH